MKHIIALLLCALFVIAGCSPEKPKASNPEASPSTQGRPETRGIEASSAVGYDGAAMRRSVDNALNKNDARNAEMQKAIDQANGK